MRTPPRRRSTWICRLLAALLLSISVGCSASAAGTDNAGTLEIANFDPFSGPNAGYGQALYAGCVPAVRLINNAGGVLGHNLKCEIVDNRGDPADAVLAARNMLAKSSKLAGIIDSDSGLLSATMPLFQQFQVTDLSGAGDVSFDKSKYPYFWRTIPGDDVNGYAVAAYAKRAGYTKIAAVFGNDVAAQGNLPGLLNGSKTLGIDVVANVGLALDKTSYEVEVHKVLNAHPQAIVTEADPQTNAVFLSELKQAGGLLPVVGTAGTLGADWSRAVTAAIGAADFARYLRIVALWSPTSGPAWQAYNTALLASEKQVPNASEYSDQVYSESAYDDVNLEALAILAAKSTRPATYNPYLRTVTEGQTVVHDFASGAAALRAGHSIRYVGVTGQIRFDQYQNSPGVFAVMIPAQHYAVDRLLTPADIAAAEGR